MNRNGYRTTTRTYYHETGEIIADLDADTLETLAVRVNFSASAMTSDVVTFTAGVPGVRSPISVRTRCHYRSVLEAPSVTWAFNAAIGDEVPDWIADFVTASMAAHRATAIR